MNQNITAKFLLVLFSFSIVLGFHFPQDDSCENNAECKLTKNCEAALKFLKQSLPHNLTMCGFEGVYQKVCCPEEKEVATTTTITTTTTTPKPPVAVVRGPTTKNTMRKSEIACKQYAKIFPHRTTFQIIDGEDAVVQEFPHMVGLGFKSLTNKEEYIWGCGGMLISDKYVLTAAHCNASRVGPLTKLRMGVINIHGNGSDPVPPTDFAIKKLIKHQNYSRSSKTKSINDIALIELDRTVTFNDYIMPACLYQKPDNPFGLTVIGWGTTENAGDLSHILQKAQLDAVDPDWCNTTYNRAPFSQVIEDTHICARGVDAFKDSCKGDSGGPLQIQNTNKSSIYSIVGIISFGKGCGGATPGVYTRISSYLSWIEDIVWPEITIDDIDEA